MKRIICFLIAAQMLLLAACGSGDETGKETTAGNTGDETTSSTESTEKTRFDELGAKDLGGRDIVIMEATDYPSDTMNFYDSEKNGDTINDAIYTRDAKIGDMYKANIKYIVSTSSPDGIQQITNGYLAGDKVCDIVYGVAASDDALRNLAVQGMLADLNDISYLSFDKPWWSNFAHENLTLGGKAYLATGDIMPHAYTAPIVMTGNLALLEKYTPDEDIYELVESGNWTVDKLVEYAKFNDDLDGDGKLHTGHDFFGYVGDSTGGGLVAGAFVTSAGVDLCVNTGDSLTVSLDNEKTIDVVSKLAKLMPGEKMDDRREYVTTFTDGRAIFIQAYMGDIATYMRDMNDDYLILPMPKYDAEQEHYRSMMNAWGTCFMGIMSNTDVDDIGFIAEALAYESYNSVRPEVYEKLLKLKLARDDRSTNMIDTIFDGLTIDFNALCDFGGTISVIADSIYKGKPLASNMAKKQPAADEAIEKFVEGWMQE